MKYKNHFQNEELSFFWVVVYLALQDCGGSLRSKSIFNDIERSIYGSLYVLLDR